MGITFALFNEEQDTLNGCGVSFYQGLTFLSVTTFNNMSKLFFIIVKAISQYNSL